MEITLNLKQGTYLAFALGWTFNDHSKRFAW